MNLNLFPIDRNAIVEQTKPGYRPLNDALFTTNNHKIMQPFIRLGVHNVDDEEDFHPKYVEFDQKYFPVSDFNRFFQIQE